MYSYRSHPALKVTRVNVKMATMFEPKPRMTRSITQSHNERLAFKQFTKAQFKINVNELVNAELYNRASIISGDTIRSLKTNYTPQQMRAFLLIADSKNYQDGSFVKYDVVAPKKMNRGIDYTIEVEDTFQIIDDDVVDMSDSDSYKA